MAIQGRTRMIRHGRGYKDGKARAHDDAMRDGVTGGSGMAMDGSRLGRG